MQLNFSYYKKYSATVIMNRNRRCKIIELCGTTIADTSKCLLQFDLFHLPLPIIVTSAKKKKKLCSPHTSTFTISFYEEHYTAQDFVGLLQRMYFQQYLQSAQSRLIQRYPKAHERNIIDCIITTASAISLQLKLFVWFLFLFSASRVSSQEDTQNLTFFRYFTLLSLVLQFHTSISVSKDISGDDSIVQI